MSSCCHNPNAKKRFDWIFWISLFLIGLSYPLSFFNFGTPFLNSFSNSTFELINQMWWGLALGIIFVGILDGVPRNLIITLMGKGGTFSGILRATFAGVLLDLCSHGILVVGSKFYKKGISLGQFMAFLIASPWNSFSLTLILWALIGFKWMITILLLSLIVAIISGVIFDLLVSKKVLPENPYHEEITETTTLKEYFSSRDFSFQGFKNVLILGMKDSKMILKWILFGVVLAGLIRTFVPTELFQTLFAPTVAGLGLTILVATVLEVCSEGSTPIAADILTTANAPGNSFTFLMTGVSTDYTEILTIKETTNTWKIALFLPLVTVPQIVLIGYILNNLH